MPTSVGPNTKGEENLVFGYDLGDVSNSYKGEPTTNIVTNTNLDTGWSKGYNKDILVNDYPPPKGVDSQVYSFIDLDGNGNGYWYSYGDYAPQDPSTVYTISLWVRTVGNSFRLQGYTANNSEAGRQYTNSITIPGDGEWHRAEFNALTTPSNTESDSLSFYFPEIPANQRVWICAPQMEPNSHATPFVNGTRSATQGLLDLTGNKTLSLASTSFTGNGNITFDGTDDTIVVPSINLQQDFTLEAVIRMYERSSFGIFGQGGFSANQGLHILYNHGSRGMIFGMYANDNDYGANWIGELNTYYHVVFTYNHETHNKEFYANGVLQNPASSTENAYAGTGDMRIGMTYSPSVGVVSPAYGDIPVSKLYNKILTADEVRNNYRHYKTRFDI